MQSENTIITKKAASRLRKLLTVGSNRFVNLARKHPKTTLLAAGLGLGGGDIVKELVVDPIKDKSDKLKSYQQMTTKVPILKGIEENKKKDYFNIVATYAPALAKNPHIAGNLVNKMNDFGGPDHKLIGDIIGYEKKIQEGQNQGSIQKTIGRLGALGSAMI